MILAAIILSFPFRSFRGHPSLSEVQKNNSRAENLVKSVKKR